jgi:hypothetical protein
MMAKWIAAGFVISTFVASVTVPSLLAQGRGATNQVRHEPKLMGSCPVDEFCREEEIRCGGDACDLHESRGRLIGHDQTETRQRHTESGVRSGKPDVTVEGKLPAARE